MVRTVKSRAAGGVLGLYQPSCFSRTASRPELKQLTLADGNGQLYHDGYQNFANSLNLLDSIVVGSTIYQRVGNRVTLKRIDVRMILNNKTNFPNVTYRVIAAIMPATVANDTWSELVATPGGASILSGVTIPGVARVLCDRIVGGGDSSVTGVTATPKERSFNFRFATDVTGDVQYSATGNALTRLVVMVAAYDSYGTLVTDNIGSIASGVVGIYYTDS